MASVRLKGAAKLIMQAEHSLRTYPDEDADGTAAALLDAAGGLMERVQTELTCKAESIVSPGHSGA